LNGAGREKEKKRQKKSDYSRGYGGAELRPYKRYGKSSEKGGIETAAVIKLQLRPARE